MESSRTCSTDRERCTRASTASQREKTQYNAERPQQKCYARPRRQTKSDLLYMSFSDPAWHFLMSITSVRNYIITKCHTAFISEAPEKPPLSMCPLWPDYMVAGLETFINTLRSSVTHSVTVWFILDLSGWATCQIKVHGIRLKWGLLVKITPLQRSDTHELEHEMWYSKSFIYIDFTSCLNLSFCLLTILKLFLSVSCHPHFIRG